MIGIKEMLAIKKKKKKRNVGYYSEFCFKLHDNLMSSYYHAILQIRRLKFRITPLR